MKKIHVEIDKLVVCVSPCIELHSVAEVSYNGAYLKQDIT